MPRLLMEWGEHWGHEIGNENCPECEPEDINDNKEYPRRCTCGGLMHHAYLSIGDEYYHDLYSVTKCDNCGKSSTKDVPLPD